MRTRGPQWSFHDSKGFIDPVQSHKPGSSPLWHEPLRACRGLLAERFSAPQHLYSHRLGTFLDSLLNEADGEAKKQASRVRPEVGWIRGLQTPQVCLTHNDVQVYNPKRLVEFRRVVFGISTWMPPNNGSASPSGSLTPLWSVAWAGGGHTSARWRAGTVWGMPGTHAPALLVSIKWGTSLGLRLPVAPPLPVGGPHPAAHTPGHVLCALKATRGFPMGDRGSIRLGCLHPQRGLTGGRRSPSWARDAHVIPNPSGEWEPKDLRYLYDRELVVGATQLVLAKVVYFWDALDRKREIPIVPAA